MKTKLNKRTLLFTLTPQNGFYKTNNRMAYLDGLVIYHPHNVNDPTGYVYFTFLADGTVGQQQVRLFSLATPNQKLRAVFDIETTVAGEVNNFFFSLSQPGVGFPIIYTQTILGANSQKLKVDFTTDNNGDALLGFYATKLFHDGSVFILRNIKVFQL